MRSNLYRTPRQNIDEYKEGYADIVGDNGGFIRKYAVDGTIVWTRQFGSMASDGVPTLACDQSGTGARIGGACISPRNCYILCMSDRRDAGRRAS